MTIEIAALLATPDRWIGGRLVNYLDVETWPRDRYGRLLDEADLGGWPMRGTIIGIEVEAGTHLCVRAEEPGGRVVACNGPLETLCVTDAPRFPCTALGEIALAGDRNHEWHLIPKESDVDVAK